MIKHFNEEKYWNDDIFFDENTQTEKIINLVDDIIKMVEDIDNFVQLFSPFLLQWLTHALIDFLWWVVVIQLAFPFFLIWHFMWFSSNWFGISFPFSWHVGIIIYNILCDRTLFGYRWYLEVVYGWYVLMFFRSECGCLSHEAF